MGTSKLDLYSEKEIFISKRCKALSHPARIRIIELIRGCEAKTRREFSVQIGLNPETIKSHLRYLIEVDFIYGEIVSKEIRYSLNIEALDYFQEQLSTFIYELLAA